MKSSPFAYVRPQSIDEAVTLLAENQDDAKVLAGGQSLLPLMAMRFAYSTLLIDVSSLDQLRESSVSDEGVRYGAGAVHSAFEDGLVPDPTQGLLKTAAAGIGYRAVRNRGTLGGSLAHADASAEWPSVMAALDATVVARSVRGEREILAADLVHGFFSSALEDDEIIVRVEVPLIRNRAWGWHKTARKAGEFAESLAVVLLDTSGEDSRAWLGAARNVPVRLAHVEELLPSVAGRGATLDAAGKSAVLNAVARELGPGSTPEDRYRTHLHGISIWRALEQAARRENAWNNQT